MNNLDMARSYLRQAEESVKRASQALEDGNYAYVVRQSQEAVNPLKRQLLLACSCSSN